MEPLNIIGWLICRLLAPRLQTGEVVGDGPPRLCDVQRSGNSTGAPSERCSCQPDAQWEDSAARGLRGRQQWLCCAAFGSRGKSQQPVAERTHAAALLRHCPGGGLCQAAHPQRWGGTDVCRFRQPNNTMTCVFFSWRCNGQCAQQQQRGGHSSAHSGQVWCPGAVGSLLGPRSVCGCGELGPGDGSDDCSLLVLWL